MAFVFNAKGFRPSTALAVLIALALTFVGLNRVDTAPAGTTANFAAGSLIIPMDTDASGNHAAFNQNVGMWTSYGLVYKLLQNGIPVRWAILATKTSTTNVDFSASVKDKRTGTALNTWDYRGGPFVIDSADVAAALPIVNAWWAGHSNLPNVHEAQAAFSADANVTLRNAPLIANESTNAGITIAYFNAAGIPDLNGNPWSTTSPNILTETAIANGGLFFPGSACLQRRFDIFVTPHNGGYFYSLTDPTNLGTKTYSQLDTFVHQGGGWTAMCHSILSNENALANLTLNGNEAVKNLFKTSLPGGAPGGFLTQTGFATIDNAGGTWTVGSPAAALPVAQLVPTSGATQSLPGGSVQTWPAPTNPGAPSYWGDTERVAYFDTPTVDHDHIIAGTYHDGTGLGKLTYIGGHSFSTVLPYSGNASGPYLRAFFNSLFFNGSAVAKLDLKLSSATFPQLGTGPLTATITNVGGSAATNTGNVSVTLAPGFTYVPLSGSPAPLVSGQTLTWPGGLGDVAAGADGASFKVTVDSSVSGTVGAKNVGQFHATFGDVFGESFTADVCRDVTIAPTPAPTLTKTPASQGPVTTGSAVTWTLAYGNTGASALQNMILEDTLPARFSYVSSSSTPSLGAATVIPAASGTMVRWSNGAVPAATPSAGTVTIVARAGTVTSGIGTPPQQTFTNRATLTGTDLSGNTYSAAASATVVVQALDITLGKTVNNTFLSTLPGSVTYTLTPKSGTNDLLSNVRVIDPVPTGVTSPAAGQGGTVGPYVPIPADPGNDPGPPALDTAVTVGSNFVVGGGNVAVTLNVKSSTPVSNVSPTDLDAAGGGATCTGPTPATANVPAGGAGVNFAWSCTLNDLGEYVFSAGASDAGATTDWPQASSASVLSAATGGPNVATWNLGSNTAPAGGSTITSGYTDGVYGLRGATTTTFQKYDLTAAAWTGKASALANVAKGGALTTDGLGTIYQLAGNVTQGFSAYDIAGNAWAGKANTGTNVGEGGALVYLNVGGTKYVYALMGNNTKTFKRYDVTANTWASMTDAPAAVKKGGSLTTDGTNIYALRGAGQKNVWRYNVGANTWTALANLPGNAAWGAGLARVGNYLYATIGGAHKNFYRYDLTAGTWLSMALTPGNVADGGSLATDGTYVYAFQGKTTTFYRYNIAANTWSTLAPYTAATGQGGALVFAPGVSPQGFFTTLDASRSLVVPGDTVKVTFTLKSSTAVNNVTAGGLTVTPTGGASCSTLTGPTLTSADNNIANINDPVIYEWTCTAAAGSSPGSLTFGDSTAAGSGPVTFPAASANSVIVSPLLTLTATVPAGAPNPVTDLALLATTGPTVSSPLVSTFSGQPNLMIVKTNSPSASTMLEPGDPITYSMTVRNTGTGNATGVAVTDTVPADTSFTSCTGGASCGQAGGIVTWTIGALAPGDTATVMFTVSTSTSLPVSANPYTISNSGTVDSDQTTPAPSNTVTNQLQVAPRIVKTVSLTEAGPGDTLTYTLSINNPGAAFTADVEDPVPAGTTFSGTGSCAPGGCTLAAGTMTWSGATIPHGTSTFSFDVTVNAGTGGSTVTNTGTLDPTSPDLDPISTNPAETEIGPALSIVKLNNPVGHVNAGDTIVYTLIVGNESSVAATGVAVTDTVFSALDYVSCTGGSGACGQTGGVVTWNIANLGATPVTLTFTATVKNPLPGTIHQINNVARATAANSPTPVDSNIVTNSAGPPTVARVTGFTVKPSRRGTIASWKAAPATDVVAYLVYRGAKRLNQIAVPAGRIAYSVRLPRQRPGRFTLVGIRTNGARTLLASTTSRR